MPTVSPRAAEQPLPTNGLFCSFCLRHQDEVDKLVAGQGHIYICDTCVAACGDWIRKGSSDRSSLRSMTETPTERLLRVLAPIQSTVEGKGSQLQSVVDALRTRKISWARIGDALGITRQAACERFSRRSG